MENDKNIHKELMDISPSLVQIERTNVYSVSSSYFDDLSSKIVDKVHSGIEPVYYFTHLTPFTVPEGYFDKLPGRILQSVLTKHENGTGVFEEMEEIAPLLNTISKKQVFSVPAGYFETLQKLNGETSKPEAKVVSINTTWHKFMRYAAAAVITALLAISGYLIVVKDATPSTAFSNNSKADVNKLSEKEIIEFLKTNSSPAEVTSASFNSNLKEHEIKNSLKEMTDKEIQQYLQENAVPDEI